jgi:signal peptidase I
LKKRICAAAGIPPVSKCQMDYSSPYSTSEHRPLRPHSDRVYEEKLRIAQQSRGSISTGRWMWEWFKAISTALLLFLVVRTFVVEAFRIPTGSMENTLLIGDFLLVNKAVYGAELPIGGRRLPAFSEPDRGHVVVFFPPHEPSKNFVKRVVGIPGDTLEMRGKVLFLNGSPVPEPYARHVDPFSDPSDPRMDWQREHLPDGRRDWRAYHPTRDNWGPLVVPAGKLFTLGDNRDNSEDSRYWGFVDEVSVRGRPFFVYYSFERDVTRPFAWLTSVRWTRIGDLIH